MKVNPANSTRTSAEQAKIASKNGTMDLGTDTFLKLMVTQMRYQDPFSGGQNMEDFMSQVAQFTLLERVFSLQKTLEEHTAAQAPYQALNLLNRTVEVQDEHGNITRGEVTSVRFENGMPLLKVGEKEYSFKAVTVVEGTE
ncbi:MAG: flagellar hook capping FlgD N-terminal domain-containing protein [Dethiobacteria bacterium]|jgi:flagellar basal-body rod modification protein FlgD